MLLEDETAEPDGIVEWGGVVERDDISAVGGMPDGWAERSNLGN